MSADWFWGAPAQTTTQLVGGYRPPMSGFAGQFGQFLQSLIGQPMPGYAGPLDPGLSPTLQNLISLGQGYSSSAMPEIWGQVNGNLGRFMSPSWGGPSSSFPQLVSPPFTQTSHGPYGPSAPGPPPTGGGPYPMGPRPPWPWGAGAQPTGGGASGQPPGTSAPLYAPTAQLESGGGPSSPSAPGINALGGGRIPSPFGGGTGTLLNRPLPSGAGPPAPQLGMRGGLPGGGMMFPPGGVGSRPVPGQPGGFNGGIMLRPPQGSAADGGYGALRPGPGGQQILTGGGWQPYNPSDPGQALWARRNQQYGADWWRGQGQGGGHWGDAGMAFQALNGRMPTTQEADDLFWRGGQQDLMRRAAALPLSAWQAAQAAGPIGQTRINAQGQQEVYGPSGWSLTGG